MHPCRAPAFLCVVLLSLPAVPAFAGETSVHALIASVLEAYGGRERLAAVNAYRMEGTLFSLRRHEEALTVRVFARPGRLKVLIQYEGGSEVRLVDGSRGWRNDAGGPLEPSTGPMYSAMVLQAARADVPWILAERESTARTIEPFEQDGVEYQGIEIPMDDGLVFRAYVHPKTRLVMMSQGLLDHGGMQTHFETRYSKFESVKGVRFAFHEENWASGVKTGVTTIERVILNPPLGTGEFVPPKAAAGTKGGMGS